MALLALEKKISLGKNKKVNLVINQVVNHSGQKQQVKCNRDIITIKH